MSGCSLSTPRFIFERGICGAIFVLIGAGFFSPAASSSHPVEGAFYVDYRASVPASTAGAFPLAVLQPEVKTDLARLRRQGTTTLAYLSVGEMNDGATYRGRAEAAKLPVLGRNEAWQSSIVDLRDGRWADLLAGEADAALARGFDGVFLDTPDTLLAQAATGTPVGDAMREALVGFVKRLRAAHPGKRIVLNRGFEILSRLRGVADGVMAESVFSGFDVNTGKTAPVAPEETAELLKLLHGFRNDGFAVYVLDYADPKDAGAAFEAARKIRAEGFSALVSTPALTGETLAPWRAAPRRVLTFYNLTKDIAWPEDTFESGMTQLPLEWLGFETDYRVMDDDFIPPTEESGDYAAVLIPRDLELPPAKEKPFVDWLISRKEAGWKVIFLGGIVAVDDPGERERLLKVFGISGSGIMLPAPEKLRFTHRTPGMIGFEIAPEERPKPMPDIVAPAGATVHLSCELKTADGETAVVTPVFTADWGGVLLSPYISWERPDYTTFWYVNPFAFLEQCLGEKAVPSPDTTTVCGLRAFLSHIDGDGFANRSSVASDAFTGDVVYSRILKKYPLPVSVSVIEAEVRCLAKNLDDKDRPRLEELARTMFRLPNVEVASHAYSHPFIWIADDRMVSSYAQENLRLKFPYKIDLDTEIKGSVDYINRELAPADKPVKLFLWTGNCRPGPVALRKVREAGIESLNGGDTVISALSKTVSAAAARSVPWGDELQVRAPMQNENVYTHLFTGKVRGSFIRLLQTFAMTEEPRRLKPANLYYHFYSADRADSLKAVESVCDWAMKTPLHPVVVSDYARSVRDAAGTRLFRDAAGRWLVSGSGEATTVRLPVGKGFPDFKKSSGVLGYNDKGDSRYFTLTGDPLRILALDAKPTPGVFLRSSPATLEKLSLGANRASFTVKAWMPGEVALGGFPAGAAGRLLRDGIATPVSSDAAGTVVFTVNPGDRIEIDFR